MNEKKRNAEERYVDFQNATSEFLKEAWKWEDEAKVERMKRQIEKLTKKAFYLLMALHHYQEPEDFKDKSFN